MRLRTQCRECHPRIKFLHTSSHRILFFRANNLQGNLAQMQTPSTHYSNIFDKTHRHDRSLHGLSLHCCKDFQKRRSAKLPYMTAWNPSSLSLSYGPDLGDTRSGGRMGRFKKSKKIKKQKKQKTSKKNKKQKEQKNICTTASA